jgi:hypothetical protein
MEIIKKSEEFLLKYFSTECLIPFSCEDSLEADDSFPDSSGSGIFFTLFFGWGFFHLLDFLEAIFYIDYRFGPFFLLK